MSFWRLRIWLWPALVMLAACTYKPISPPSDSPSHHPVAAQPEPENWEEILPSQLAAVKQAAAEWVDFEKAEQLGWKAFGGEEPLMGQHYYHPDGIDYVSGDLVDFSRPNSLMYARIGERMTLSGVAFTVRMGRPIPYGYGPRLDTVSQSGWDFRSS